MEQITVSSDSYGELFRSLSHKKRNGILALQFQQRQLRLMFREGRIVGVTDPAADEVSEIAMRLVASGCIMDKVATLVKDAGVNANQLYDLLVGKEYVSADDFRRAQESHQLDLLHSLTQLEDGYAEFAPKLVRNDSRHAFSVYPTQLLLDVEELRSDKERLQALFSNFENVEILIRDTQEGAAAVSDGERRILDAADKGCRMDKMISSCLMSQHEAIESLLTLYDQDVIELIELESDAADEDGTRAAISAESSEREEAAAISNVASAGELGENQREPSVLVESEAERAPQPEPEEEQVPDARTDTSPETSAGFRARLRAGSYHLLNPSARSIAILVCTAIFLIALAILGTALFEEWFFALREFTSN